MAVLDVCFVPSTNITPSKFISCSPDCTVRQYTIGPRTKASTAIQQEKVATYSDRVLSVSAAPQHTQQAQGTPLIAASSLDHSVLLLSEDFSTFRPVNKQEGHTGPVTRVRWDPKSTERLISAGHDGNLIFWDVSKEQKIFAHHIDSSISTMSICESSGLVLTGSQDHKVRLWDSRMPSDSEARSFDGHSDFVLSVGFSSDGSHIFSGSKDRSLRCWNLKK
jgi:WD40 repeat protein